MSHESTVCVVLYTHMRQEERFLYAQRTLASLLNLSWHDNLRLHVADDNSPPDRLEALVQQAEDMFFQKVTASHAGGTGYGGSHNLATQTTHLAAEVLLPLEDDWELKYPLDLDPYTRMLTEPDGFVRCVRMGYLGWTQDLRGTFAKAAGQNVIRLDPDSPERHVAAGHPRLETREYQQAIGPWLEHENAGAVEHDWCGRPQARQGVVWPVGLAPTLWVHIGTVQARRDQVEAEAT